MKTLPLICVIFVDGSVMYTDSGRDFLPSMLDAWRETKTTEELQRYEGSGAYGAACEVRFLESDYWQLHQEGVILSAGAIN